MSLQINKLIQQAICENKVTCLDFVGLNTWFLFVCFVCFVCYDKFMNGKPQNMIMGFISSHTNVCMVHYKCTHLNLNCAIFQMLMCLSVHTLQCIWDLRSYEQDFYVMFYQLFWWRKVWRCSYTPHFASHIVCIWNEYSHYRLFQSHFLQDSRSNKQCRHIFWEAL